MLGMDLTRIIGWVPLSDWTACSVSCGGGRKTRTRKCKNGKGDILPPSECGADSEIQTMICNPLLCAAWSDWDQTVCSTNCGYGQGTQTRSCLGLTTPDLGNEVDPRYCRGKPANTIRSVGTCFSDTCPGWTAWEETACSEICGGGLYNRTRECRNEDGQVSNPGAYPELCPGGIDEELDLPCNTHACPPPLPCPAGFPFAFDSGSSCCRYDTATDACGGDLLGDSDPQNCCRGDAFQTCANVGGWCITRADANTFCQRDPSKTLHFSKWSFFPLSGSATHATATSNCADDEGGILLTLNEPGSALAFNSQAFPPGNYWTTLRDSEGEISRVCTDATCSGVLQWSGANQDPTRLTRRKFRLFGLMTLICLDHNVPFSPGTGR